MLSSSAPPDSSIKALPKRIFSLRSLGSTLRRMPLFEAKACRHTRLRSIAQSAVRALESAIADPVGLWILEPHHEAGFESSWTGVIDGEFRNLAHRSQLSRRTGSVQRGSRLSLDHRLQDRSARPLALANFLEPSSCNTQSSSRAYAQMMRLLHGDDLQLRLGLYYPLLGKLIWWPA